MHCSPAQQVCSFGWPPHQIVVKSRLLRFDPRTRRVFLYAGAMCRSLLRAGPDCQRTQPSLPTRHGGARAHGRRRQHILSREHGRIPSTLTGSRQSRPMALRISRKTGKPFLFLRFRKDRRAFRTHDRLCDAPVCRGLTLRSRRLQQFRERAIHRRRLAQAPRGINPGAATRGHSDHKGCLLRQPPSLDKFHIRSTA